MRLGARLLQRFSRLSTQYSNLPDEYVERAMEQVYYRTPKDPRYTQAVIKRKKFRFTTERPWTAQFQQANLAGSLRKKVFVEPIAEWNIFRGDRVEVLVGRDKGKQGIVSQIIAERNWVIVEGLNTHFKRVGKKGDFPGVIIRQEAPLLVTNQVKLVDPSDLAATEIEWRYTEEGEKVRVSTRTGRVIPIPEASKETIDYKDKRLYKEREKDTKADVVTKVTFEPRLETFEMSIMRENGIEEERVPAKTYWY
ncbi:large ribosomal subunit protein uL24m [Culicoides brevitarsis]|uniref:large ribosomal subunit protein uL24m n=1 Tax=Culicoides brevitarsis TaxID=469753 RepID=UPI00307BB62E